jgi:hypothetical protein
MSMGKIRRAVPDVVISHWYRLVGDLKASPQQFYGRFDAVLQRQVPKLESGKIEWREGGPLSPKRQYHRLLRELITFDVCAAPFGTGFFVSWRLGEQRLRLNIVGLLLVLALLAGGAERALADHRLQFYLMIHPEWFAVAGCSLLGVFFLLILLMRSAVGQGLADLDALLLHTPIIAGFYEKFLRPVTYYRIDLALMYEEAVHAAVLQIIDELTEAQKLPRLSESERKPILRDLYKRRGLEWPRATTSTPLPIPASRPCRIPARYDPIPQACGGHCPCANTHALDARRGSGFETGERTARAARTRVA